VFLLRILLILAVSALVFAPITGYIAYNYGRSFWRWFGIGMVLPFVSVFVALFMAMRERAAEGGERGDRRAAFVPAADGSIRDAQGERCIGIARETVQRKLRLRDERFVFRKRRADLIFERLSRRATHRIGRANEHDRRIGRCGNRRSAAVVERLADGGIGKLRTLEHARGDRCG